MVRSKLRAALLASLMVLGWSRLTPAPADAGEFADLKPLATQPNAADLQPGLTVSYYYKMFEEIREIDDWAKYKKGVPGEPIKELDMRTVNGKVFDSGVAQGVGMYIPGLIHFDKPGDWSLVVRSNDGVRVEIAGKRIIYDPDVHSDRYSDNAVLKSLQPGWYDLRITYFQKKGTAALQLFWTPPGSDKFVVVPAEALAHLAGQ